MDFKAALRRIFGIETPKDEKGLSAMIGKADATMSKVSNEVSKKLGKMKVMQCACVHCCFVFVYGHMVVRVRTAADVYFSPYSGRMCFFL